MASITINFSNDYIPRIKAAYLAQFEQEGNLDPSNEEILVAIKTDLKNTLKYKVREHEKKEAVKTAKANVVDLTFED